MILLDGCRYEAYKEEAFFRCGAVELAKKLLGKYLYCHQSDFLVRIMETEAYPHGDEVYKGLFETGEAGPGHDLHTGDELRMMKTILERLSVKRTPDQRKNLLVNPDIVVLVLAKDLEGNTVLYEGDGVQLFHKMAVPAATEPDLEPILHRPRIYQSREWNWEVQLGVQMVELGTSTTEVTLQAGGILRHLFPLRKSYERVVSNV